MMSTIIVFPLALGAGWLLARKKWKGKSIVEAFFMLPLVIPPVATGLILLHLFSRNHFLGQMISALGIDIFFTWKAVLIAASVMSFPLMLRATKVAFEQVNSKIEDAAKTLGATPWDCFFSITLPLASRGLMAGSLLAFARAIGEFGATIMIAGLIPGQTITLALGIYYHIQLGQEQQAMTLVAIASGCSIIAIWMSNWILQKNLPSP